MAHSRPSRAGRRGAAAGWGFEQSYWLAAKRPLQILAFLLPLILAYELALTFLLQSQENVKTVLAHRYLLQFFEAFRVAPQGGLHIGGIVIIVVLLVWHILQRDPWRISFQVCGLMALETLALSLPLLVLSQLIARPFGTAAAHAMVAAGGDAGGLDLWSQFSISIGAGLYEELMFRMLLIAALHTLLVDLAKASHNVGATIAVIVSAAAFTGYHRLESASEMAFLFLAGLYFGAVYVIRGFGIVAGTHAVYDIITFSLLTSAHQS